MSNEQIVMRNISKKTGISAKSLKYKNLKEIDWKNIIDVMHEFSKDNLIYINDRISTIPQLKRRIRQAIVLSLLLFGRMLKTALFRTL